MAAGIDDVGIGIEVAVSEVVLAQILPDVLLAVEFRAIGRQPKQGDIVGDSEGMGDVPACAIQDDDSMATDGYVARYFYEVLVHGVGIGKWENQCCPCALGGADRPKDIGTSIALIGERARA